MAITVQRWRKRATGVLLVCWLAAAAVIGSSWVEHGVIDLSLFIGGVLLMGIGVMGRIWCLVCIAGFKNELLVTDGPYSLCRNPLYLFSLLGTIGVGMATGTFSFPLMAVIGFAVWYPGVISFEERNLNQRHGAIYDIYREHTPALVPACGQFHEDGDHTVRSSSFRRGLFDCIWFFAVFAVMHFFCELHRSGLLPVWWTLP